MRAAITYPQPLLVSLRQLADEWAVDRKTVRRALDRAGIKPFVINSIRNGSLRYDRAEVQTWLQRQRR